MRRNCQNEELKRLGDIILHGLSMVWIRTQRMFISELHVRRIRGFITSCAI